MEFEREGKGLRLIETNDYLISATVEKLRPVFGESYSIKYELINKSKQPLQVSITGTSDKNIEYSFQQQLEVVDREEIIAPFYVHPLEEDNNWRARPKVTSELQINGKKALFQIGIDPQFPLHVDLMLPGAESYKGVSSSCFLNLENKYDQEMVYSLRFADEAFISFAHKEVTISLQPREKKVYNLHYTLHDFGFLNQSINISTPKLQFQRRLTAGFAGMGAKFSGESKDYYHLYHGRRQARLNKKNSEISFQIMGAAEDLPEIPYPKLGKPYSSELSRKKPDRLQIIDQDTALGFKASYQLEEFQDVQLTIQLRLYAEGLIEHWYELENTSEKRATNKLFLHAPVYFPIHGGIMPYQEQIISVNNLLNNGLEDWDSHKITENWLFHKGSKHSSGLTWFEEYTLQCGDWDFFFEHELGVLEAQEKGVTRPMIISLDAYRDWPELRSFARKKFAAYPATLTPNVEWTLQQHNPFVQQESTVTYKHHHNAYIEGTIMVTHSDAQRRMKQDGVAVVDRDSTLTPPDGEVAVTPQKLADKKVNIEEKLREVQLAIPGTEEQSIQPLVLQAHLKSHLLQQDALLIKTTTEQISNQVMEQNEQQVYSSDNGVLRIKAAPQFGAGLYSLEHEGVEWLHSSYPNPTPKSWWNPWLGGLSSQLNWVEQSQILKEKRYASHTTLQDCHGNRWQGIKLTVEMKQHEGTKGLIYHQYYLLLPGAPVLCYTTEIEQMTGYYFRQQNWHTEAFIKAADHIAETWVKTKDAQGQQIQVFAGQGDFGFGIRDVVAIDSDRRDKMLQMVTNTAWATQYSYVDQHLSKLGVESKLHLNHGEKQFTPAIFYILTDQLLSKEALQPLSRISFGR